MCLITDQKEPFIAEEGITVYKLLEVQGEKLKAWMQDFEYEVDKVYSTTIQHSDNFSSIDPYDTEILNNTIPCWKEGKDCFSFGAGFHSLQTKERAYILWDNYHNEVITECIIPKDSEYYLNPSGGVVSNQIIIKRILSQEEVDKIKPIEYGE